MFRQRPVLLVLGGAATVVLLLGAGSFASGPAPAPTRQGDAWPNDFVVHLGYRAVGQGQLVARAGEPTRLCGGNQVVPASMGAQYRCTADSLEVRGANVVAMAGAHRLTDALVVNNAVVRGVWDGRVLAVDSVGGPFPVPPLPPVLTCQYRVPGAVPEGPETLETEAVYRRLQDEVEANPGVYGGLWVGGQDGVRIVVATTGDLVSTGRRLREVFPFPLCLASVEYPTVELERIAAALRKPGGLWQTDVSVERNRVLVHMPLLDAAAVEALAAFPGAEARPLLVWDGPLE